MISASMLIGWVVFVEWKVRRDIRLGMRDGLPYAREVLLRSMK
jgi:hypothetical protein